MPLTYIWASVLSVRLMFLHNGYESPYFLTLAFCAVGVPAVTLWPARLFIAYEGVLLALFLAPLALGLMPIPSFDVFTVRLYALLGFMMIGATAQWMHNRMVKDEVDSQARLASALQQIQGMKEERHAWLERLAEFLRHELKNQIVAVGTSLDLMERPGAERHRYVGRARRGLARMSRLVSSATEATSLQAALNSEERSEASLSAVVEERIDIFRQSSGVARLVSGIEAGVMVKGNEDRLAQMVDKLLSNAAEHVADDGEIRVTLNRNGQKAVLVVEDEGDPLPSDKQHLFNAFVSVGKRESDSANVGLGLFVAQVIAESFGGHVTAEDLPAGSGARMIVRLPLL